MFGPKKYTHRKWISAATLQGIAKRKEKKAAVNNNYKRGRQVKAQEEYGAASREEKRKLKEDKRAYMETLAAEAAYYGNTRGLYCTIRRRSGKY